MALFKAEIKVITVLQEGKGIQFQSQIKQSFQLGHIMFSVSSMAFLFFFFPSQFEFSFSNLLHFVTQVTWRRQLLTHCQVLAEG